MSPFLLALGLPAPTAVGTDLAYATITKMAGSVQHYRQRSVNLQVAVFLGLGSIPAGLLGVQTVEWIKKAYDPHQTDAVLKILIAVVVILAGLSLIIRSFIPKKQSKAVSSEWDGKARMSRKRQALTVLLGAVGGYLVGLTSIGSGSMIAIILLLLYPLSPAVIVGTDVAHATVLSLVVGLAHTAYGNIDFGMVGTLLIGGIPGVLIGSKLALWVPGRPLRLLLAGMLIFVGMTMILR
jgi:uncharacterized membrane protein YfcA